MRARSRYRFFWPACVALLGWLALTEGGWASPTSFTGLTFWDNSIDIKMTTPFSMMPKTGFIPVRITVLNKTDQKHAWDFLFKEVSLGSSGVMNLTTSIAVEAGGQKEVDVYLPISAIGSDVYSFRHELACTVRGYGVKESQAQAFLNPKTYHPNTAFVVFSGRLGGSVWDAISKALESQTFSHTSFSGNDFTKLRHTKLKGEKRTLYGSTMEISNFPDDDRGWMGVSGLWIEKEEWRELAPEQRQTIRNWIWSGGKLFIATGTKDEKISLPLLPELTAPDVSVLLGLGEVVWVRLKEGYLDVRTTTIQVLDLDYRAFQPRREDFLDGWESRDKIGNLSINVGLIIGFAALFCVLVCPVNLRLIAPANRRYRLFWSVPALSIGMSALLVLGIIGYDGFGGYGRQATAVVLTDSGRDAWVFQEQSSKTALLLSREFQLEANTMMTSISENPSIKEGRSYQVYGDSRMGGDWFSSRSVQSHFLRRHDATRSTVTLRRDEQGRWQVLSRIPCPLTHFYLKDLKGKWWYTASVPTGVEVPLRPATDEAYSKWWEKALSSTSLNFRAHLGEITGRQGYFFAEGEATTEAPIQTLEAIDWIKGPIVYAGPWVKEEGER